MPSSVVGHAYQLQFTENLATAMWETWASRNPALATTSPFTLPHPDTAAGFFRFIISR